MSSFVSANKFILYLLAAVGCLIIYLMFYFSFFQYRAASKWQKIETRCLTLLYKVVYNMQLGSSIEDLERDQARI